MIGSACVLCSAPGGVVLWSSSDCRVVRIEEPGLPGFCRVIWREHIGEMSDLAPAARNELMRVVFAVEAALRECWNPDKINLASFGNVVPHLHWHVIPRWRDDRFFPEPVWGRVQRDTLVQRAGPDDARLSAAIVRHLAQGESNDE